MIHTFSNVLSEFTKVFIEDFENPKAISLNTYDNEKVEFPVRYYKNSAKDLTEEKRETYPIISIQNYRPTFIDDWNNEPKNQLSTIGYFIDKDKDGKEEIAHRLFDPFYMEFQFDVSCATKREPEIDAISQYFIKRFGKKGRLNFNEEYYDKDREPLYDPVFYFMDQTEVPREDGIFEVNNTFRLRCWIYLLDPEVVTDFYTGLDFEVKVK